MRVPPDQSSTLAEHAASASSGSFSFSARVTLVSRVPNRKVCTRFRASVTACRKCRNSRVYWLIEPEISSSATIGGMLGLRPAVFQVDQRAAGLHAGAQRAAQVDAVAVRMRREPARLAPRRSASTMRLIASLACGDLGRAHLREVLLLQHLAVGHGEARVELDLLLLALDLLARPENSASSTRCAGLRLVRPAPARRSSPATSSRSAVRDSRACGRKSGTPGRTAPNARAASRTPRAASSRNPRLCRRPPPAPPRAHRAPSPARAECRRRAARARNRRCSRRGGPRGLSLRSCRAHVALTPPRAAPPAPGRAAP